MKKAAILCFFVLFMLPALSVRAQVAGNDTLSGSGTSGTTSKGFTPKKTDIHVQAGTWFSTSSGYGNGWGTYIAPQISYALSPRFRITGGISIANMSFSGYKPYYDVLSTSSYHGNVTSAYLFVSGQYLVNERLTVTGSAFKKFNIYDTPGTQNPFLNDEPYGGNLNIQYKIGNNVYLEGGIGFTRGASYPYYGTPAYAPIGPLYNPYFPGH